MGEDKEKTAVSGEERVGEKAVEVAETIEAIEERDVCEEGLRNENDEKHECSCGCCEDEEAESEACSCDCCEGEELEFDEDDIVGYITDENEREIGIIVLEDGEEVEYLYAEEESEECFEIEIDEDDIVAYITDEDDREIGFVVLEDGEEVEYYFAEESAADGSKATDSSDDEADWSISKKVIKEASKDVGAVAKEGAEVARELKSAYDDIMGSFDFLKPKKK